MVVGLVVVVMLTVGVPTTSRAALTSQDVARSNHLDRWNLPTRAMSVGGAYAADANGLQGGLTNPASLSRLQTYQFSVEYQRWRKEWDLFNAGIAVPMYGGHSLAVQGTWLDYGELEPSSPTQLFRPQGNEFKGGLSYSYRWTENSAVGFTVGGMTSEIGFRERQYATFVDLGYLYRFSPDLWLGASVNNVVGELTVDGGPDKLPRQSRLGLAWAIWQNRFSFTADAVYHQPGDNTPDEDATPGVAGGMRFLLFEHWRFSAGYHSFYDGESGPTGGIQVEYPNFEWKLSYLDTEVDDLFRVGGNMRF
jgi:hypothetical protein